MNLYRYVDERKFQVTCRICTFTVKHDLQAIGDGTQNALEAELKRASDSGQRIVSHDIVQVSETPSTKKFMLTMFTEKEVIE